MKITTFVPLQFKKRGVKKVVEAPFGVDDPVVVSLSGAITPSHDPTLLKALARGYYWQHLLDTGAAEDAAEIAKREGLHRMTVSDALCFALLAPGIVQAAQEGTLPRTMTLEILQRQTIPLDWAGQRGMVEGIGRNLHPLPLDVLDDVGCRGMPVSHSPTRPGRPPYPSK